MHESGEDYLETIYILKKRNGSVRSVDVANELNFSRPSVSRAVGILKENGYLTVEEDGELVLTKLGLEKAKSVYDRHTNLTKFLMLTAGVDEETAETDACRIEHIISPNTFAGIKKYIKENSK
ncbi:MAG: metal-dependent transcriptional regulator [Butyrivibrio sp.]|uniref:metal-dependent transcriptional regulator n=1 Tax=Butyrivibrio sp. TaxID=28121 RepID=UPI0025F2166F|nr:metal-dependent transcriptional regulator [Butyrivibrio sp.]MCR5771991.1 metal-dependent transcriptional regulator [Butyrivibrio sp.]